MLTKTKIALAAVLFAGTASIASAQEFDPNLANRYPAYADPIAAAPRGTFRSAPVRMLHGRNAALQNGRARSVVEQPSPFEIDRSDRASSPYAGGP